MIDRPKLRTFQDEIRDLERTIKCQQFENKELHKSLDIANSKLVGLQAELDYWKKKQGGV